MSSSKFPLTKPPMPDRPKKWKGSNIFDKPYWITAILGKRRSGKTTLTYNLLKYFASKRTIVIFIVPTFYNDDTFIAMRKYLDEQKIQWLAYTDVKDDNGVDVVEVFMKVNARGNESDSESDNDEKTPEEKVKECPCKFGDQPKSSGKKKKKKPQPPEYLFVTDDLTDSNRAKSITNLAKRSFHYKCKILISTQSIVDIPPQLHAQIDYYALFRGFNQDSLEKLYQRMAPRIEQDQFMTLYHTITNKPVGLNPAIYNFLLFDKNKEEWRINLERGEKTKKQNPTQINGKT